MTPNPVVVHEVEGWLGDALTVGPRGLQLDGVALADLAAQHGTPLYVYGTATVQRRLAEMRGALRATGCPFRILYAVKANRFRPFLEILRQVGDVGIDAASPREMAFACEVGFRPDEISVTVSMASNRDLARVVQTGTHVNLDTHSALRRYAELGGTRVGLRLDPGVKVGWGLRPKLCYGESKFGFPLDDVASAATYAASLGLEVDTLHVHAGWGLQEDAAPALSQVYQHVARVARGIPSVRFLNVGGGLCWRQRAEDRPLALSTWSALLREHLAPTGCTLIAEPGTWLAASSGVLVAEVNTVEARAGQIWIGVDAGHNVNVYPAHYDIPLAIIPVAAPLVPASRSVHVAGNINEANDVFARALPLPDVAEGDLLAFYPCGAYGSSMASDHCMRGLPVEVLI